MMFITSYQSKGLTVWHLGRGCPKKAEKLFKNGSSDQVSRRTNLKGGTGDQVSRRARLRGGAGDKSDDVIKERAPTSEGNPTTVGGTPD